MSRIVFAATCWTLVAANSYDQHMQKYAGNYNQYTHQGRNSQDFAKAYKGQYKRYTDGTMPKKGVLPQAVSPVMLVSRANNEKERLRDEEYREQQREADEQKREADQERDARQREADLEARAAREEQQHEAARAAEDRRREASERRREEKREKEEQRREAQEKTEYESRIAKSKQYIQEHGGEPPVPTGFAAEVLSSSSGASASFASKLLVYSGLFVAGGLTSALVTFAISRRCAHPAVDVAEQPSLFEGLTVHPAEPYAHLADPTDPAQNV